MILSDTDFATLQNRVADGKKFLEEQWGNHDYQTQQWVRLWQQLSGELFDQMCARGMFPNVTPHEKILQAIEEKVERNRKLLVARGVLRAKKERRARTSDQTRPTSYTLF